MMKICMIGIGSIGSRHLKNISDVLSERGEQFQIDALRSSCRPISEELSARVSNTYFDLAELPSDYDAVFITNPTAMHYETLKACVEKTKHVFLEKPVFDRTDYDLEKLNLKPGCVYYVACPLRYRRVTQYIKDLVQKEPVFSARSICSTYLPDWRPGVDYRKTYSAKKEMGGGVSIDLIHEWDYLCYLFGKPKKVCNFSGTYSNLAVTSDDLSVYIAEYDHLLLSLHLDYFGRYDRREVELYLGDDVVVGDYIHSQVRFLRSGQTIELPEERNEYQKKEIACFFDMIAGKQENHNPISLAYDILKITKGEATTELSSGNEGN